MNTSYLIMLSALLYAGLADMAKQSATVSQYANICLGERIRQTEWLLLIRL